MPQKLPPSVEDEGEDKVEEGVVVEVRDEEPSRIIPPEFFIPKTTPGGLHQDMLTCPHFTPASLTGSLASRASSVLNRIHVPGRNL